MKRFSRSLLKQGLFRIYSQSQCSSLLIMRNSRRSLSISSRSCLQSESRHWKLRLWLIILLCELKASFMRCRMCSCGSFRTKVSELISSQVMAWKRLIFSKMSSGRNWQPELRMQFSFLKMLGKGVQEALCRSSRLFLLYMEQSIIAMLPKQNIEEFYALPQFAKITLPPRMSKPGEVGLGLMRAAWSFGVFTMRHGHWR